MGTDEIEQAVQEIIKKVYCSDYCKKITVLELIDYLGNIYGYDLKLILNQDERPIRIILEGTVDNFLKNVELELYERNLIDTKFYTGYKVAN